MFDTDCYSPKIVFAWQSEQFDLSVSIEKLHRVDLQSWSDPDLYRAQIHSYPGRFWGRFDYYEAPELNELLETVVKVIAAEHKLPVCRIREIMQEELALQALAEQ